MTHFTIQDDRIRLEMAEAMAINPCRFHPVAVRLWGGKFREYIMWSPARCVE